MKITNENKEEVFAGIIKRAYDLPQMREIKAQFEVNPQLHADFQFYKRMIYSAQLLETQQAKENLALYRSIKSYQQAQAPKVFSLWPSKPMYRWAAAAVLVVGGLVGYQAWFKQPEAQYVSIAYQKITPANIVINGPSSSVPTTDTLQSTIVIVYYPDDEAPSYLFRGDTLVLYGQLDTAQLRYQVDYQTQSRILFVNNQPKPLMDTQEKKELE